MEADVSVEALDHGNGVPVGSDTEMVVLDPTASDNFINFTIQPKPGARQARPERPRPATAPARPVRVQRVRGHERRVVRKVPGYTASVNKAVLLSLDDPTFAGTIPTAINSSQSGWSVVIPTPAVGKHTLYAQSVQGFDSSAVVARHFTVNK